MGKKAATTLALVMQELATNSLKYGALSSETGTIDVSCPSLDDEVVIVWTERGGPPVTPPKGPEATVVSLPLVLCRNNSRALSSAIGLLRVRSSR